MWWIAIVYGAYGIIFGLLCMSLANKKGYYGYYCTGFFLGVFGLIYVGSLPNKDTKCSIEPIDVFIRILVSAILSVGLFLAGTAITNYESPADRAKRILSTGFTVDQNAVDEIKEGMKYGEQLAKDTYEKYKDDPVKYKEESDRIFQEMLDKITNGN
jgi:hypothetical protein